MDMAIFEMLEESKK